MKQTIRILFLGAALACAWAAHASGAPWYRWKNRLNHTILCSKIAPGDVWDKFEGPYADSRCKKEGMPQ